MDNTSGANGFVDEFVYGTYLFDAYTTKQVNDGKTTYVYGATDKLKKLNGLVDIDTITKYYQNKIYENKAPRNPIPIYLIIFSTIFFKTISNSTNFIITKILRLMEQIVFKTMEIKGNLVKGEYYD